MVQASRRRVIINFTCYMLLLLLLLFSQDLFPESDCTPTMKYDLLDAVGPDVGMDKHVSSAGSDFQPRDAETQEGGEVEEVEVCVGRGFSRSTPTSLSTRPEQRGPGPFHQSDLRDKHSSIPEKRSHIYKRSGNRGRLMKCRRGPRRGTKQPKNQGVQTVFTLFHREIFTDSLRFEWK